MINLFDVVTEPFTTYAFMRKALAGCAMLTLGSAPLGVLLILRRMSLMGEAMSHAILPGIAAGFLCAGLSLPAMGLGGLVAGLGVAFLVGLVTRLTGLREDANLAVFYLMALAAGVLLVALKSSPVDLTHLLFGSVLAVDNASLLLIGGGVSITLIALAVFYRPIMTEAFDPVFMRQVSRLGPFAHMLFLTLVVLNLVAGFQALGTLMAVGLMMIPAATARFWARHYLSTCLVAAGIGMSASAAGLLLSYYFEVPSGPSIILMAGGGYLFSVFFGRYGSIRARYFTSRHLAS